MPGAKRVTLLVSPVPLMVTSLLEKDDPREPEPVTVSVKLIGVAWAVKERAERTRVPQARHKVRIYVAPLK